MLNKKGFTLAELLIVIAILAILIGIAIPTYGGIVSKAKCRVCEANIATIIRLYKYQCMIDESCTLEGVLAGNYAECADDIAKIKCPDNGTYTVKDGKIVCSVHGEVEEGGGSSHNDIKVESVTLDKTSMILAATTGGGMNDGPKTLVATVFPANAGNIAVTWESSNTGVATVDSDGVVRFVSPGTAVITVTTVDGGKTATCTVKTQW